MRKLLIGFVSLGVVLAAYLLYSGLSDTPVIDTDAGAGFIEDAGDSNIGDFDGEIRKIDGVGLGTTKKAYYYTLNKKTKAVEREWGFEKLLHEVRDVWELEKPYINVFESDFACYITADKGQVQVETAVGSTTPRDAMFSGNVVIHILPKASSETKESFIYLDDITFLSDRSLLSTAGPVEFVSDDVQMRGTGLELVYNDQSDRLEFFRIVDLEALRIKDSQVAMFSTGEAEAEAPPEDQAQQPDEIAVALSPEKAETMPEEDQPPVEEKDVQLYKLVFSDNVLIDTPRELVFADDRICISDILWSKDSSERSGEVDAVGVDDANAVAAAGPEEQDGEPNTTVAQLSEPNEPAEPPGDIVITCDNGLVLVPMDSLKSLDDYMQPPVNTAAPGSEHPEQLEDDTGRTRFMTPIIDYNRLTGDVVANGLTELTFYAEDQAGAEANEPPAPIRITARDGAEFFPVSNHAVFKGDCVCTMPQADLTVTRDVTFESPEITVHLPQDKSKRPDIFAAGPAKLTLYLQDANDTNPPRDANDTATAKEPMPITITAQRQARFSAAANQIIFEDDCRCTTVREDPNGVTEYMLLSELITVDLPEDTNDRSSDPASDIKHLTASGGVVRLATTKTAKADPNLAGQVRDPNAAQSLGGVELQCSQVDYDPVRGLFVATGPPAIIQVKNSKISASGQDPNGLSLSKPCYAFFENFDTLKYFIHENRIVADAVSEQLLAAYYFPVVDGKAGEGIAATAPHVEVFLTETAEGRTELSSLAATGGIRYMDKEKGGDNEFLGSQLFYDHQSSIVKVTGDESQPCYFNGALLDQIEYNVKTRKTKSQIVAPGALQISQ